MILQSVSDRHLVYVDNPDADWSAVARQFGMLDDAGMLQPYVIKSTQPYTNANGVSMPGITLTGKTVKLSIVADHMDVKTKNSTDLIAALNYFPVATLSFRDIKFVGKYKSGGVGTVYDNANRGFTVTDDVMKNLAGIHDLMTHLDLNNGKLFEPVIARYVYTAREMHRRLMPLVGYFDLDEYLRIIKDDRRELFYRSGTTNSLMYLKVDALPIRLKIDSSTNGVANVSFSGKCEMFDTKKVNSFRPYVILSLSPLKIRDMSFPWSKVTFDRTTVFMSPMMSKPDLWGTLQGGLDLLSAPPRR